MLKRAASALKRILHRRQEEETPPAAVEAAPAPRKAAAPPPRPTRRPSDIGVDVASRTYTPPHASGKAGFRSDGVDHQRDQDFATGANDDRWKDEDRFTNKSNDPRIGTHGRTYEPGESRDTSRSE